MSGVTRRCKQCTRVLPVTDFRECLHKGMSTVRTTYQYCKECEYINASYRKAMKAEDLQTVTSIEELFQLQRDKGGVIPRFGGFTKLSSNVASLKNTLMSTPTVKPFKSWSTEQWLTEDLSTLDFDAINDYVCGSLKEKMVRQTGVSTILDDLGLPTILYDEPDYSTWKKINSRVLDLW